MMRMFLAVAIYLTGFAGGVYVLRDVSAGTPWFWPVSFVWWALVCTKSLLNIADEDLIDADTDFGRALDALGRQEKIMTKMNKQDEFVAGRHFSCDCGLPWHALYVGPFFGELMNEAELVNDVVTFTVVVEPSGRWERLKGAARVLFGRHDYHEMSISREQWPAFVAHINHIDAACKRTRERYENMRI